MDKRVKNGSVLMEFIIVLPIYMILLGMAFFYGELSLHGVNLAASADRTIAGTLGGKDWNGFGNYGVSNARGDVARAISPNRDFADTTLTYREEGSTESPSKLSNRLGGEVKDRGFEGSWTWLVAAKVEDDYAMTPWTRGMVGTWAHLERMVKMKNPPKAVSGDSVLGRLFNGNLGRTSMTGKDLGGDVKIYSYYTLMRNAKGRIQDQSYRYWTSPGGIVTGTGKGSLWYDKVYDEPWQLAENYLSMNATLPNDDSVNQGHDPPGSPIDRPFYERYEQFKTWSN